MPWMRVSIGVGGLATAVGIAGMLLWIDDGSNYFALAVAVASAGFLTLISCVLTRVFGSSHGSQDDAFRRGKSMGYDEGFLEGHRSARPVVVPLRLVDRDLEATVCDVKTAAEPQPPSTMTATVPRWRRESRDGADRWARVIPWAAARRIPLLVGVVSLALLCALGVSELLRPTVHAEALKQSPGKLFDPTVLPLGSTPLLVRRTGQTPARTTAVSGMSPVAPLVVSGPSALHAGESANPLVLPVAVAGPGTFSQPVAATSARVPVVAPAVASVAPVGPVAPGAPVASVASVAPAVAAPVVPLTAAEQTAVSAKAAADLTAANAAAAAAETARVAAAAAEATRLQALADAYAVAHPNG